MKHNGKILSLASALLLIAGAAASAQSSGQSSQPGQIAGQQTPSASDSQPAGGGDPIRLLNLTPEQREQIRSIREQNREERAAINQRLREANLALDEALDAEEPAEGVIEQRVRDVSAAQAAAMRMRVLTEIRIRRVLTLEQRRILKNLQREAIRSRQERRMDNAEERQRRRQENRSLQNPRNTLRPGARRDPQQLPRP